MKKYDQLKAKTILEVVKNMEGERIEEIVSCLNSRGITNANGGRFTVGALAYFIGSRKDKATPPPRIPASMVSRLVVGALLAEPSLNDRQRVTMLQAYLDS